MTEELYELRDNLKREIGELSNKNDITPTELDRLYKAVDIIKDITTIEAMEDGGYSNANYSNANYSNTNYAYDDGMRYMRRGNSYARGRDSMGRYTSHDGPMHEDKESLMRQIEELKSKLDRM